MLSVFHSLSLAMRFSPSCCRPMSMGRFIALLIAILAAAASASGQTPDAPASTVSIAVVGSGPDLVLIPGLAGGGAVWDGTVARLRDTHTLHVVTLAGFGGQPAVAASTQDGFLDAVRDELGAYVRRLDRPVAVAGHSLGGWTALRLGLSAPDAVSHVVVVDALPFLGAAQDPSATEASIAEQAGPMKQMMALAPADQFRLQQQMTLRSMISDPDTALAYVDLHAASDPATVAQAFYDMFTVDLRDDLADLSVPTLVLAAGSGYGALDVGEIYERQYAALPGVRIEVVPDARHFIQLDQPDALAAHLRAFLSTDSSR